MHEVVRLNRFFITLNIYLPSSFQFNIPNGLHNGWSRELQRQHPVFLAADAAAAGADAAAAAGAARELRDRVRVGPSVRVRRRQREG